MRYIDFKYRYFGCILIFLLSIMGCEESTQLEEKPHQLVVSAFLTADEPIDSVFVMQAGDLLTYYDPANLAVTNALVTITLVDTLNSSNNNTYTLSHDSRCPGRYSSSAVVLPLRRYELYIEAPDFPIVQGVTTVPGRFSILNSHSFPDTIKYNRNAAPIQLQWSQSHNYSDYICSITSLDSNAQLIRGEENQNDNATKPSKTTYWFNMQGKASVELPWFMVRYYGCTQFLVEAIDLNYYNYLRQRFVSGNSELREIQYSLKGGIGVFGSSVRAHESFVVVIRP